MTGQVALMLGVVACAAGEGSFAKGANEEICRQFHQECSEARAQGARDAGISATSNGSSARLTPRISPRPASESGRRAWMHDRRAHYWPSRGTPPRCRSRPANSRGSADCPQPFALGLHPTRASIVLASVRTGTDLGRAIGPASGIRGVSSVACGVAPRISVAVPTTIANVRRTFTTSLPAMDR